MSERHRVDHVNASILQDYESFVARHTRLAPVADVRRRELARLVPEGNDQRQEIDRNARRAPFSAVRRLEPTRQARLAPVNYYRRQAPDIEIRRLETDLHADQRLAPGLKPEVIEVKDELSDNEYVDVVNYFEADRRGTAFRRGDEAEKYNAEHANELHGYQAQALVTTFDEARVNNIHSQQVHAEEYLGHQSVADTNSFQVHFNTPDRNTEQFRHRPAQETIQTLHGRPAQGTIETFHRRPAQETETFQRRPAQETETFHRRLAQETETFHRRPAQETETFHRRPAQETETFHRRPAEETETFHRRPAQETETFHRRPAQETETFHRRPAQETETFHRRPAQKTIETYHDRPAQETIGTFNGRLAQETVETFHRRPAQTSTETLHKRPALKTIETYYERPAQETIETFNGRPTQESTETFHRRSAQETTEICHVSPAELRTDNFNSRDAHYTSETPQRRDGVIINGNQRQFILPIDLTRTSPIHGQRPQEHINQKEEIKILKPEEINNDFINTQKYHLLKKQLASEPLAKQITISRNLNNQIEKQSRLNRERLHDTRRPPDVAVDESILFSECCRFDPSLQPYAINVELSGGNDAVLRYSAEDLTLRYRVLVFLWILLGERRLIRMGYPSEAVHLVLWRVVHICCSISGVKSAAAVPLPGSHDCGTDMLCFRDHVHRFLEVCAPTRDHWKQFGWASLTVDAVMSKIYKLELLPTVVHHTASIPVPVRMAMCKLANLEKVTAPPPQLQPRAPLQRWRRLPRPTTPLAANRSYLTSHFRPILPKPVLVQEKKKRGRPVKMIRTPVDTAGRIERVMLWRFVLNLLEEPGNAACIHWLNRDEGIFRILNTDWLARIWGRRHGNPRMTYEKMARAMRTYYRSKVLQPVPRNKNLPRKLVYRFNPALIKRVTNK